MILNDAGTRRGRTVPEHLVRVGTVDLDRNVISVSGAKAPETP
jgi:hypothetical protein